MIVRTRCFRPLRILVFVSAGVLRLRVEDKGTSVFQFGVDDKFQCRVSGVYDSMGGAAWLEIETTYVCECRLSAIYESNATYSKTSRAFVVGCDSLVFDFVLL